MNIPVEAYNLTYESDQKSIEVVAAESSMRVYYFECDNNGYKMNSRDLIGKGLYSDGEQNSLVETISYSFSDNVLTVNNAAVEQITFGYTQFKDYCLEYFGDNEDKHFKEDLYNLMQVCLSESKINDIGSDIMGDKNLCRADIKTAKLIGNTGYTDIVKKRVTDEQYVFFTNQISELSATTQRTVTFKVLTDANYESIYPVIEVWHMGVSWFKIDMLQFI